MSISRDRDFRGFALFMLVFVLLFALAALSLSAFQVRQVKELYLAHDEAVASALLEAGVSKSAVAAALTGTETTPDGQRLTAAVGIGARSDNALHPFVSRFQSRTVAAVLAVALGSLAILAAGTIIFARRRVRLYTQADVVLNNYINGDYSAHLPQNSEGAVYQLFAAAERLATMLQAQNETEHQSREFLKDTISDISHQLKTPLAALTMYQEIISNEPENADTVRHFAEKMGVSLKRMEQLILSMLKITRLDAGNIVFEKKPCRVSELVELSLNELTTRAKSENKRIITEGDATLRLSCDMAWTAEAVGNIVKNALDHMSPGGTVRISWEQSPAMLRLFIADDGGGIAPEDIYHIFKRFYRSKNSLATQGVGLGLPLAKSIVEGQGGMISVQSELNRGTVFALSFLTEL